MLWNILNLYNFTMKTILFIPFILLTTVIQTLGFEYHFPESAVYSVDQNCYFVSNFQGSGISKVTLDGEDSLWIGNLSGPLGLLISDGILYAIDSPRWVKGFDLKSGNCVFSVEIPDAQFLNDLTTDGNGNFYASDSRAGKLYWIQSDPVQVQLLVGDDIPGVNGVYFDAFRKRIIACTFKDPAQIVEISLASKDESSQLDESHATLKVLVQNAGLVNLDGIAMDANGDFYISSWSQGDFGSGFGTDAGMIYKFDPLFRNPPEVAIPNLDCPADINYCKERMEMLVPEALKNEFVVIPLIP